jgi:hypothetical protein
VLNELKTAITAFIRIISQTDLQKVFGNKIKRVQACIDGRGHHLFISAQRLFERTVVTRYKIKGGRQLYYIWEHSLSDARKKNVVYP